MARFFLLKTGGTKASGSVGTLPTGSFATQGVANYYDVFDDIIQGGANLGADDFVLVSDAHIESSSVNLNMSGTSSELTKMFSVDDSNIDITSPGASIEMTGAANGSVNGDWYVEGVTLIMAGIINIGANINFTWAGGSMSTSDASFPLFSAGDGSAILLDGVALSSSVSGIILDVDGSSSYRLINCPVTGVNINDQGFRAGGGTLVMDGCDLSLVSGVLIANVGANVTQDDTIDVRINNCRLSATSTFTNEDFRTQAQVLIATRCSDVSAEADHQYHRHGVGGDVNTATNIFREESVDFTESGDKVSYQVVTNAVADYSLPVLFDLPADYTELSTGGADLLTMYFASTTTLTDNDIWATVTYPDGTTKQAFTTVTNQNSNVLGSGTTHTDDSGSSDWRDGGSPLAGHNEYRMTLDTSGDVGADSYVSVTIYVGIASTTIYVDSTVVAS